jgi:hypothetical protein
MSFFRPKNVGRNNRLLPLKGCRQEYVCTYLEPMLRFLNYFRGNIWRKIWRFFAKPTASFCTNLNITLVFVKNVNFFRRKLKKIAENYDQNMDSLLKTFTDSVHHLQMFRFN